MCSAAHMRHQRVKAESHGYHGIGLPTGMLKAAALLRFLTTSNQKNKKKRSTWHRQIKGAPQKVEGKRANNCRIPKNK